MLFVDDQAEVLTAISRSLRGRVECVLASRAEEALQHLRGPALDVVVSDLSMPDISGAELLKRAAELQPDAIRLVLSGQSDIEQAVAAVNDGAIFRFLLKPLNQERLMQALNAAMAQRRLIHAERELLEQTLTGAIDALSETLALSNPLAFSRGRRLKRIAGALARKAGVERAWALEVAAMLSQLGSVTLPQETAQRWNRGEALTPEERQMVSRCGPLSRQLLARIPRLEPVLSLLDPDVAPSTLEARVLKVARALEARLSRSQQLEAVLASLESDESLDQRLVAACRSLGLLLFDDGAPRSVALQDLREGMVLADDVRTASGALLIARGHEVSQSLLVRLRNFAGAGGLKEPLLIRPRPQLGEERLAG